MLINILATCLLGVLVYFARRIVSKVDKTADDLTELKIEFAKLSHHSCPLVTGHSQPGGNGVDHQAPLRS